MRVLTDDIEDFLRDESKVSGGTAISVALPETEHDVVTILEEAYRSGTTVTPSGARTGIVGGAIPHGGIVLSTELMKGFRKVWYEPISQEWRVCLEPGVTLAELMRFAEDKLSSASSQPQGIEEFQADTQNYFFPIDATETTASIGGIVVNNASGARSFKYGPARRWVRALRMVLAGGDRLQVRRGEFLASADRMIQVQTQSDLLLNIPVPDYKIPQVKHTAGFFTSEHLDLIDLLIGSEGTLGVITEVEVALSPQPELWFGGLAFLPSEESAVRLVQIIRDECPEEVQGCQPAALEYFDESALRLVGSQEERDLSGLPAFPDAGAAIFFEQECTEATMDDLFESWATALELVGGSIDQVWSAIDSKEHTKLKGLRHLVPEKVNCLVGFNRLKCPAVHKVGTDLAVPNGALGEIFSNYRKRLAEEDIPAVVFGHIGDNNVHVNMLPTSEAMLARAKQLHQEWAAVSVGMGGTVVAEHGIGQLKGNLLRLLYDESAIAQMQAVKHAFDPKGILSPGHDITKPTGG